jgi:hypothetical protein
LNINTYRIIESGDVIWLNKTYSQHMEITQFNFTKIETEENDKDLFEPLWSVVSEIYQIEQQLISAIPMFYHTVTPSPYPMTSKELSI